MSAKSPIHLPVPQGFTTRSVELRLEADAVSNPDEFHDQALQYPSVFLDRARTPA